MICDAVLCFVVLGAVLYCDPLSHLAWQKKKVLRHCSGAFVISATAGRPNFFTYRKISLHA